MQNCSLQRSKSEPPLGDFPNGNEMLASTSSRPCRSWNLEPQGKRERIEMSRNASPSATGARMAHSQSHDSGNALCSSDSLIHRLQGNPESFVEPASPGPSPNAQGPVNPVCWSLIPRLNGRDECLIPRPENGSGECLSFSERMRGIVDNTSIPAETNTTHFWFFTLFHVADWLTNLASMFILVHSKLYFLFTLGVSSHLVTCLFCIYAAHLDEDVRRWVRERRYLPKRYAYILAFFFFGLLQFIQVKLAWRDLRHSETPNNSLRRISHRISKYHCKAVDGAIEGMSFATLHLYLYMTAGWLTCADGSQNRIHGFDVIVSHNDDTCEKFSYSVWYLLVLSGWLSFFSAGTGILEVDYSISDMIASMMDGERGMLSLIVHLMFRTSEVAMRLWYFVFSSLLLLPGLGVGVLGIWLFDYVCCVAVLMLCGGREKCRFVVMLLAFTLMLANVVQFVDTPVYSSSARHITKYLFWIRLLEVSAFAAFCIAGMNHWWEHQLHGATAKEQIWVVQNLSSSHYISFLAGGVFFILYYGILLVHRIYCKIEPDLYSAAEAGDHRWLGKLLEGDAILDLDQLNSEGFAPLHLAVWSGSLPAVKLLLEHQANPVVKTGQSWIFSGIGVQDTPVHIAARAGWEEGVRALLEAHADLALKNKSGKTAEMVATSSCRHVLLELGSRERPEELQGHYQVEVARDQTKPPADISMRSTATSDNVRSPTGALDSSQIGLESSFASNRRSFRASTGLPVRRGVIAEPALDSDLAALIQGGSLRGSEASSSEYFGNPGRYTGIIGRSMTSDSSSASRQSSSNKDNGRYEAGEFRAPGISSYVFQHGAGALSRVFLTHVTQLATITEEMAVQSGVEARWKPDNVGLSDFRQLKMLGEGSYGIVLLVEAVSDTNKRYALKILKRQRYTVQHMLVRARQERHILQAAQHPFIVKLEYAFHTPNRELALVMEFCVNGDLEKHLIAVGTPGLPEIRVRVWAAEVTLALQYLHQGQVIFRDLKAENLVLDENWHAKLTDFGLAKAVQNKKASTFVGSPGYMAPEMSPLLGPNSTSYGVAVDVYSLGVVLWVLLAGGMSRTDFTGAEHRLPPEGFDAHDTLLRWLTSNPGVEPSSQPLPAVWPPDCEGSNRPPAKPLRRLSKNAHALISGLIKTHPQERFTLEDAKNLDFFAAGTVPCLSSPKDWDALLPLDADEIAALQRHTEFSSTDQSVDTLNWSFR